jgi:uncharacterized protein YukE
MAQVIVDPDELRAFANRLISEARALKERQSTIESHRDILESVWKDQRYEAFEKAYLPSVRALDRFCKQVHDYAAYLRRKADAADRYLRGR